MTNRLISICLIVAAIALYTVTTYAGFDGWGFNNWTIAGGTCKPVSKIPVATVAPTSLSFGNVTTGSFRTQTVTLTNTGTDVLNSISHSMQTGTVFTNRSSTCTSLAPGQSCSWQVKFAPVAAGSVSDTSHLASTLPDVDVVVSGTGVAVAQSYLLTEYFNGANSAPATWTTSNITPTWNYATAPAPLEGSGSLYMPSGASSARIGTATFTAQSDVYAAAIWTPSATQSINNMVFAINTVDVFTNRCSFVAQANGQFGAAPSGGTTVFSGAGRTYTAGQKYYVLLHYITGTGSNAQCIAYVATTAPANLAGWGTAVSATNGTATSTVDRVGFYNTANSLSTHIFDALKVGTSLPTY